MPVYNLQWKNENYQFAVVQPRTLSLFPSLLLPSSLTLIVFDRFLFLLYFRSASLTAGRLPRGTGERITADISMRVAGLEAAIPVFEQPKAMQV
jgi:hypothetical protein